MKTYNNLFGKITAWDNLLLAARKASHGRRFEASVAKFNFRLESELLRLQHELQTQTYRPGPYTTFMIYDPKERMISAAPFRDRVVHHALCNVMEPIFEKTFVHDSFANRKGKGTHKAIERYQHYARTYRYVLKSDIRKFFPSLDHEILKREFRWKISCADTLWLADLIVDNSNEQEPVPFLDADGRRRGLPIGNLTSQFWANVYLNSFDHFVKEALGAEGYVRYVDDFVVFSDSKQALGEVRAKITERLLQIRLVPHPNKTHIHYTAKGVPFLGFQVWPRYRIAKKERVRRFERHIASTSRKFQTFGKLGFATSLEQGLNSWLGHVRFGQSRRLQYRVFWNLRKAGVNVLVHPRGSWRVL